MVNLEQSGGSESFIKDIDDKCLICMAGIPETIVHRFWGCKISQTSWDFSIGIINTMKAKLRQAGPWRLLDWQHEIFGKKVPTFPDILSRI